MSVASTFGWYMLGVALHVLWRWSGWKANNEDRSWRDYWTRHLAFNIKSIIIAVVLAFIWTQELVWWLFAKIPFLVDVPKIAPTALASIAAGFALELVFARVVKRIT